MRWYNVEYLGERHGKYGTRFLGSMVVYSKNKSNAIEFVKDIICGWNNENEWLDNLENPIVPGFVMDNVRNANGKNWSEMNADERYEVISRFIYRASIEKI